MTERKPPSGWRKTARRAKLIALLIAVVVLAVLISLVLVRLFVAALALLIASALVGGLYLYWRGRFRRPRS